MTLTLEQAVQLLADARGQGLRQARRGQGRRRPTPRRRPPRRRAPRRARPSRPAKKAAPQGRARASGSCRRRGLARASRHAPPDPRRRPALSGGRGRADAGRNEILKALRAGAATGPPIKAILRELDAEGFGGRRRKPSSAPDARRAREVCRRTTVLDGHRHRRRTAICCCAIPQLPDAAHRPAGRERWRARRRASATGCWHGCSRPPTASTRRGSIQRPAAPAERGGGHRRGGRRRAADPLGRSQGQGRIRASPAATWAGPSPAIWCVAEDRRQPAAWVCARAEVRERIGRPDDPATLTLMTAVAPACR